MKEKEEEEEGEKCRVGFVDFFRWSKLRRPKIVPVRWGGI
jgi:hypothetical protein